MPMRLPFGRVISYAHTKNEELEAAFEEFFEKPIQKIQEIKNREKISPLFEEWLIFDFVPKTKRKFIIEYCLINPDRLPTETLDQIKNSAQKNRYSIFEILKVKPGISVKLYDIVENKTYTVYDKSGTSNMSKSGALCGRIGKVGNKWFFTGSDPFYLSATFKKLPKRILNQLKTDFNPKLMAKILMSNTD